MREKYPVLWGKFDSPMTAYLYDCVMDGWSDESASLENWGDWADRIGRRIVAGDSRGFVTSWKCATVADAECQFAEHTAGWYEGEDE